MHVDRLGHIEFKKNEMLGGYHESSIRKLVRPLPTAQLDGTDENFNNTESRQWFDKSRNQLGLAPQSSGGPTKVQLKIVPKINDSTGVMHPTAAGSRS